MQGRDKIMRTSNMSNIHIIFFFVCRSIIKLNSMKTTRLNSMNTRYVRCPYYFNHFVISVNYKNNIPMTSVFFFKSTFIFKNWL